MPSPTQSLFRSEYVHTEKETLKGRVEVFLVRRTTPGAMGSDPSVEFAYVVHDKLSNTHKQGNRTTTATTDTMETFPDRGTALDKAELIIKARENSGFIAITVKDMNDV